MNKLIGMIAAASLLAGGAAAQTLTEAQQKALDLVAGWKTVCDATTFGMMAQVGDQLCLSLIKNPMDSGLRARILAQPQEVFDINEEILRTRCANVPADKKPKACEGKV